MQSARHTVLAVGAVHAAAFATALCDQQRDRLAWALNVELPADGAVGIDVDILLNPIAHGARRGPRTIVIGGLGTGDLHVAWMGLLWIAVGVALATGSRELAAAWLSLT